MWAITWLKYVPAGGGPLAQGPGARPVRGEGQVNNVLIATRGLLKFAVDAGEAPKWVIPQLYEAADTRSLPLAAQGESTALRPRVRARHRLKEPDRPPDRLHLWVHGGGRPKPDRAGSSPAAPATTFHHWRACYVSGVLRCSVRRVRLQSGATDLCREAYANGRV